MNIAVLMTCHNRRDITLRCLSSLRVAVEQLGAKVKDERLSAHVFLVDDGSTDGTGDAVQTWHESLPPSSTSTFDLNLIAGTGNLYWAKGMALAWREALRHDLDYFLWLNDDAILRQDALVLALQTASANCRAVINGTMIDSSGNPSYGYNVRNTGLAGNFVLVPRVIYEKVGPICDGYHHSWADRDYGMQVEKAGFLIVSCGVVGETEWHPHRPLLKNMSLGERIASLRDPKGWNVHDLWLLRKRNWNVLFAYVSAFHLIVHVLIGRD